MAAGRACRMKHGALGRQMQGWPEILLNGLEAGSSRPRCPNPGYSCRPRCFLTSPIHSASLIST